MRTQNRLPGMGRRRFLTSVVLGAPLVAVLWLLVRMGTFNPRPLVVAILRKHLHRLPQAEQHFAVFAEDLVPELELSQKAALISNIPLVYERTHLFSALPWTRLDLRSLEDAVVGRFLLATDFFQRGADPTDTVNYLGIYDPYDRICGNPFQREPRSLGR